MPTLPAEWVQHLADGVSHRVGGCSRDGTPAICRALAADQLPDGRILLLLAGDAGQTVIEAVRQTAQVAVAMACPGTNRTLHLKGSDAVVGTAGPEHEALLAARLDAFVRQLKPFGFTREMLMVHWYGLAPGDLMSICFSIDGAWNQSPGPGAGEAVELR